MDSESKQGSVSQLRALFMLLICCAEFPLSECSRSFAKTNSAARFTKLFVFGDSYADIGNGHDPKNNTRTAVGNVNQPWLFPYGQSRGAPSGRYGSGLVLSDYLADYMGLHPRPYSPYQDRPETRTEDGMNFAVGDAGVFDNLGFTKSSVQISQFKAQINAGVYTGATVYSESLVLFTISGNDYWAFVRNTPILNIIPAIYAFVPKVVDQMIKDLKSLYDLGFRDFAVSYLPPVGCLPGAGTKLWMYSHCNALFNTVSTQHNRILESLVSSEISTLSGANVIFLNTELAFNRVFTDPQARTEFPDPLRPCCEGQGLTNNSILIQNLCSDVDAATGKPQFTVCSVPSTASFFFWDYAHPTETGWAFVFNLFLTGKRNIYTNGISLSGFLRR